MTLGNAVRSFCGPSQNTVTHAYMKVLFRSIARILMNPPPGKCHDSPLYAINATWRTSAWKLLFLSGTVFEVPCVHLPRQLSSLLLLVDLQGTPLEIGGGWVLPRRRGELAKACPWPIRVTNNLTHIIGLAQATMVDCLLYVFLLFLI